MYARCPDCRDRFPILSAPGTDDVVDCSCCGKRHRINVPDARTLTLLEKERERKKIGLEDAVSVVLGLVTLEDVLSRGESAGVVTSPESVRAEAVGDRRRWKAVALALVALSTVAGLVGFRIAGPGLAPESGVMRPKPPVGVEPARDENGALVRIRATDPADVLIAYCALGPEPCEPRELFYGSPPDPGLRFGVLRPAGGGVPVAIEIRRSGGVQDWVAGDGAGPIPLRAVPDDAGVAIPVGRRSRR